MLHPYMLLGELAPTILRELAGSPMNGTKSSADFSRYAGTSSRTKDARKSTGIGSDACSGIFPALAAGFRSGIECDLVTLRLGH